MRLFGIVCNLRLVSLLFAFGVNLQTEAAVVAPLETTSGRAFSVGVSSHFGQGAGLAREHIPLLAANGWNAVRDEIFWDHTELTPGEYRIPERIQELLMASSAQGVKVLLILGYGHPVHTSNGKPITADQRRAFAAYAKFVAQAVRGRVASLEIWNEWDIEIGGGAAGSPGDYLKLLREVVPAIRSVAPEIELIGGSSTPESIDKGYLGSLVSLGLLDWVDAISLHPYVWARARSSPADAAAFVRNATIATRGKPVYITEVGWPTHSAPFWRRDTGVSEIQQFRNVCETMAQFKRLPSVRGLYFYGLRDAGSDSTNPEHRFGLMRADGSLKPAFALKSCPP